MKKKEVLIFVFILSALFIIFSGYNLVKKEKIEEINLNIKEFQNKKNTSSIESDDIFDKNKFLIFGKYFNLSPGKYEIIINIDSENKGILNFDIASERGKEIILNKKISINKGSNSKKIIFTLYENKEIEPRISKNDDIRINALTIKITKISKILPLKSIFINSILFSILFFLIFKTFLLINIEDNKYLIYLSIIIFIVIAYEIISYSWISEDAFITLRHVKNFLKGYGPVYNPGERVEGFSHVLWFYILVFFKSLGLTYKASVILPSLFLSFTALYIMLFKIKYKNGFNLALPILFSSSAFIDFSTGGLETPLSFFLIALFSKFILEDKLETSPIKLGIITGLLILTRPDFGVFYLFLLLYLIYLKIKGSINYKRLFVFFISAFIPNLIYEIFRMGYYGALFPNPFYTKSAIGSHFSYGLQYLMDFFEGNLSALILLFVITSFIISFLKKEQLSNRLILFFLGIIHIFFVIRGGGDFMHGRFLLPGFLLISLSSDGFEYLFTKKRIRIITTISILIIFFIGLNTKPIQKRGKIYNKYGISDERYSYYKNEKIPLKYIFKENLIFMWKNIGINYHNLSKSFIKPIKIAYKNVGFLGFYAGEKVYVLDKLGLTDPVVSRIKIKVRGRPGHEKHSPFAYLVYKKLTFGNTPFKLWNKYAKTKFGILWDLSGKTLFRLRSFIDKDFKEKLDKKIIEYILKNHNYKEEADFLFFLKTFWYPYAKDKDKESFDNLNIKEITNNSSIFKWIERHKEKLEELDLRIKGRLSFNKFIKNIKFALIKDLFLHYEIME